MAADDRSIVAVRTPEWPGVDGKVHVRTLSSVERDQWEESLVETRGKKRDVNLRNARAKLVALAACDADGAAIFVHADVEALGQRNAAAMDRIYAAAAKLSGIREEDVEELVGNSECAPSEDCGTASQDNAGAV